MKKTFVAVLLSLSAASPALGAEIQYRCFSYYYNGDLHEKGTMDLTIGADSAKANIVEEMWDDGHVGGKLNPKYRSHGYVKYGSNLVVEETLLTGGKRLRDGSMGGFARVEGQAEGGFYQYKFVCRR